MKVIIGFYGHNFNIISSLINFLPDNWFSYSFMFLVSLCSVFLT